MNLRLLLLSSDANSAITLLKFILIQYHQYAQHVASLLHGLHLTIKWKRRSVDVEVDPTLWIEAPSMASPTI